MFKFNDGYSPQSRAGDAASGGRRSNSYRAAELPRPKAGVFKLAEASCYAELLGDFLDPARMKSFVTGAIATNHYAHVEKRLLGLCTSASGARLLSSLIQDITIDELHAVLRGIRRLVSMRHWLQAGNLLQGVTGSGNVQADQIAIFSEWGGVSRSQLPELKSLLVSFPGKKCSHLSLAASLADRKGPWWAETSLADSIRSHKSRSQLWLMGSSATSDFWQQASIRLSPVQLTFLRERFHSVDQLATDFRAAYMIYSLSVNAWLHEAGEFLKSSKAEALAATGAMDLDGEVKHLEQARARFRAMPGGALYASLFVGDQEGRIFPLLTDKTAREIMLEVVRNGGEGGDLLELPGVGNQLRFVQKGRGELTRWLARRSGDEPVPWEPEVSDRSEDPELAEGVRPEEPAVEQLTTVPELESVSMPTAAAFMQDEQDNAAGLQESFEPPRISAGAPLALDTMTYSFLENLQPFVSEGSEAQEVVLEKVIKPLCALADRIYGDVSDASEEIRGAAGPAIRSRTTREWLQRRVKLELKLRVEIDAIKIAAKEIQETGLLTAIVKCRQSLRDKLRSI